MKLKNNNKNYKKKLRDYNIKLILINQMPNQIKRKSMKTRI